MKHKNITKLIVAASLSGFTPILAMEEEMQPETKMEMEIEAPKINEGSLTAVISDSATFATLTAALKAAGLDTVLGGNDNYTIFAPTDEAFGKLPAGTLDKLLMPANKEKLRSLLLYHVIPGKVFSTDLKDDMEVTTANGELLEIDIDGDEVKAEDAMVYSTDTMATNGVMHSVGEVIVPESLDGFAGLDD
ncbi:fasciclin domain-containing protein [Luteolibacter sp. AS25]|uniref:fasciclin domain-containing protein n=1 Tax=Luteolibacter sp. AS25 TaxID=3135776 RepID=UPI00398ADEDB